MLIIFSENFFMFYLKSLIYALVRKIPMPIYALAVSFFMVRLTKKRDPSIRVLLLDKNRFGDEIKELDKRTNLEFISCPVSVHDKINAVCHYNFIANENKLNYSIGREQHLKKLLPILKKYIQFDVILSAGMYYRRNQEWEGACVEVAIPFVCLHKEGVVREKYEIDNSYSAAHVMKFRKFYGTRIIFGNKAMRDRLCELAYIDKSKTSVITPARFDNVFEFSTRNSLYRNEKKPLVVLFSFFPWAGISREDYGKSIDEGREVSWTTLYDEVHSAVIRLAVDFNIDVIIKPKWYSGKAKEMLDEVVRRESGRNPNEISGLKVVDDASAQDLIESASVIIAFNSTTMVEALLVNKPVVVPVFAEAAGYMSQFVRYKSYLDSFITASSKEELISLTLRYAGEQYFKPNDIGKLVRECVGTFDGKNSKRVEGNLISLCQL